MFQAVLRPQHCLDPEQRARRWPLLLPTFASKLRHTPRQSRSSPAASLGRPTPESLPSSVSPFGLPSALSPIHTENVGISAPRSNQRRTPRWARGYVCRARTHPVVWPPACQPSACELAIVRRPRVGLDLPWTWLCRRRCIRGIGCPDGSTHPALVHPVSKYARPLPPPSSSRTAKPKPSAVPVHIRYRTCTPHKHSPCTSDVQRLPYICRWLVGDVLSVSTMFLLVVRLPSCFPCGARQALHTAPAIQPTFLPSLPSPLPTCLANRDPSGRTPCILGAARPPPTALLPMHIRR